MRTAYNHGRAHDPVRVSLTTVIRPSTDTQVELVGGRRRTDRSPWCTSAPRREACLDCHASWNGILDERVILGMVGRQPSHRERGAKELPGPAWGTTLSS